MIDGGGKPPRTSIEASQDRPNEFVQETKSDYQLEL
jgi:hypothetical protein